MRSQEQDEDVDVFPFYIGDDVTDEDAFRMMGDLGGIGIIVSDTAVEDGTAASYALHNPLQVVQFLDHFANTGERPLRRRGSPELREAREASVAKEHAVAVAKSARRPREAIGSHLWPFGVLWRLS